MDCKTFDWRNQKIGRKGEVLAGGVYRCAFCGGKGVVSYNKKLNCPACSGTAAATVPGLAVICAYCDGSGRAPLNKSATCIVCRGRGVVPVESKDPAGCPACKGRGRAGGTGLPCLICKGKGVIAGGKAGAVTAV